MRAKEIKHLVALRELYDKDLDKYCKEKDMVNVKRTEKKLNYVKRTLLRLRRDGV